MNWLCRFLLNIRVLDIQCTSPVSKWLIFCARLFFCITRRRSAARRCCSSVICPLVVVSIILSQEIGYLTDRFLLLALDDLSLIGFELNNIVYVVYKFCVLLSTFSLSKVCFKCLTTRGVSQSTNSFLFDLSYAFSGELKFGTDFF